MAREYGQLRHDLWLEDSWRALTVPAQHLYMTLLADADLTYCGVTRWRPAALAQRAAENPTATLVLAAQELAYALYVVIDEEVEEVLICSYLRHDPILKNPRLSVTMARQFATIGSNRIRAAIVFELSRLKRESPEWVGWEKPEVKSVLRQNGVNPADMNADLTEARARFLPSLLGDGEPTGLPSGLPSDLAKRDQAFTPALQLATSNKQHQREHSSNAAEAASSYPQVGSRGERDGS